MRRLSHEMLALFGSRMGVAALGLLTGVVLARGLGPHDRGLLALALLLPSTLMTLCKLGITQANVYCVRREGAPLEQVAANSLLLALGLSLACAGVTWWFAEPLSGSFLKGLPLWALALSLWRLPWLLADNFFWGVLQAMGQFSLYNRRTLAGAASILVGVALAWFLGKLDLAVALYIYAGTTTVVVASLLVSVRRRLPFGWRPDTALLGRQLRFGVKSYTQILTTHLLFRSDVYLVAYFLDPARTAFYSLALHFTEMLLEIPQAVGWVVYPKMAGLEKADVHRFTAQTCRRTIALTLAGGVAVILLGPVLIPLWYGPAFAEATHPLPFAALGAVSMAVFTIVSRDFTSRNRQAVNIQAGAVALLANVGLNVFLIPAYGIVGAALATGIAYTLAAGLLLWRFRVDSGIPVREVLVPTTADIGFILGALLDAVARRNQKAVGWIRQIPIVGRGVATLTARRGSKV